MNLHDFEDISLAPVLLVSRDPRGRREVRELLASWALTVEDAWDVPAAARRLLFQGPHAAVICDDRLPNGSAVDLMRMVRGQGIPVPFVVMSNGWRPLNPNFSRFSLVTKPVHGVDLWEALNWVLDGGLVRYHQMLDARDAAAWSRVIARETTLRRGAASSSLALDSSDAGASLILEGSV